MMLYDIGKSSFLGISTAYGQVNSAWLFVCLMPICLVAESAITYIYFKRIRRYASAKDKSEGLKKFWKIMIVKILITAGLY